MDLALVPQLLANGVMVGAGYALAAAGLTVIFGILGQVNFAHGELYTIGAYLLLLIMTRLGIPYGVALLVLAPLMAVMGWLLARSALLPTMNRPFEASILATLALAIIAQNALRLAFGATPLRIESPLDGYVFELGDVLVFGQRAFVAMASLAAFACLWALFRYTRLGITMRAAAESREACVMVGIDIRRVTVWTAALGAALCGWGAGAIAPLFDLYPNMGTEVVFKSFAIVIIGGMGNLPGALLAGLALGVLESLAGGLLSTSLRDGVSFAAMILVLLLYPHGLFGRTVRL